MLKTGTSVAKVLNNPGAKIRLTANPGKHLRQQLRAVIVSTN